MNHLIFPIVLSFIPIGALAESVDFNAALAQEIAESLHEIGLAKA